jgi:pyridoxine 5-phosphate synthase
VGIALELAPDEVCLVPETREEVTTEGGLNVLSQEVSLSSTVARLKGAGIRVSMFIEPEASQVEASARIGADIVELHTGAFANALGDARNLEVARLVEASSLADSLGLQVNAGHGINYMNIGQIREIPHLQDLNIGHAIVSRSVFVGLEQAVSEMLGLMRDPL